MRCLAECISPEPNAVFRAAFTCVDGVWRGQLACRDATLADDGPHGIVELVDAVFYRPLPEMLGFAGAVQAAARARYGGLVGSMATSTSFWTIFRAFLSSAPPRTRCGPQISWSLTSYVLVRDRITTAFCLVCSAHRHHHQSITRCKDTNPSHGSNHRGDRSPSDGSVQSGRSIQPLAVVDLSQPKPPHTMQPQPPQPLPTTPTTPTIPTTPTNQPR